MEIINRSNWEEGDYIDESGLLFCGKCQTEKQYEITLIAYGGKKKKVSIMCRCKREQYEANQSQEEKEKTFARIDALKRNGITDAAYLGNLFRYDDMRNPKITEMCKEYAENFEEMAKKTQGYCFTVMSERGNRSLPAA